MVTVEINKTQAKEFAETIFKDIENYIQTHQEEYNEFLIKHSRSSKEKCIVVCLEIRKDSVQPSYRRER